MKVYNINADVEHLSGRSIASYFVQAESIPEAHDKLVAYIKSMNADRSHLSQPIITVTDIKLLPFTHLIV